MRVLAVLLVLAVAWLAGSRTPGPLPSPRLQTVNGVTDPNPPTNVVATPADRALALSWTASTEPFITGYRVYVDGVLKASPTGTSTTLTGLVNGQSYTITLRTVTFLVSTYEGTTASTPVVAVPRDSVAPAAPTGLAVTPADQQVTLTWNASGASDFKNFRLSRDGVLIATVTGTSYVDTGRTNGTSYAYSLVAVDTSDNPSTAATTSAVPRDAVAPAEPTGLTGTPGDRQMTLTWDANGESDLKHYELSRGGALVATVTGTSYVDTGLTNGDSYTWSLVAVDTSDNVSPFATVIETPRDAVAPAPPTGLAAAPDDGQLTLSWDASGETDLKHYELSRDGVLIATLTGTSYVDSGLTNGVAHAYELVAVDTSDNVSTAATTTATARDAVAPAEPTGLTATPGDGQVSLSWDANGETDLKHYELSRDGVLIATVTGTSYDDPALTNGVTYTYDLVAVDTSDNASGAATTTGMPTDTTAPAAPTGLVTTPDDGQIGLAWDPNAEPDLDHYELFRDGVSIATLTGTSYDDPGLTNGVSYAYELVAVDTNGNVSSAATATDIPRDAVAPAEPTGLAAVAGDGEVRLSWDANAEPDLDHYELFRDGVPIATLSSTTYDDPGLTNGVSYTYELVAVDTSGNPSTPATTSAEPQADAPPAAPDDVTASVGDRQTVVRWTAVAEPDVVEYRVLDENGDPVATVAAPGTSTRITGLVNGTSYTFTVVAVDAGGNISGPSAAATVVPAPATVPTEGAGQAGGLAASSDGRFVVVGTRARREASDTNTAYELYLIDRAAGSARRIAPLNAKATGATDPTNTSAPAISDDGRYIALATTAALLPADTNRLADVYRLDTTTGAWTLVSVPAGKGVSATVAGTVRQTGPSVNATSPSVVMSADGDLVLFYSARADLVAKDTNAAVDVFAKRMSTGAVTRVSTTAAGGNLTRAAAGPGLAVTPDGRYAIFPAGTSTGPAVLYRKTLSGAGAGEIVVVSSVVAGGRTTEFGVFRDAGDLAISDDGRYVALVTAAKIGTTTPTANWTAGLAYRKDTVTGAVLAMGTGQRTVWEHQVELDPTGRYAFFSTAAAEVPGDTNGHTDHHRRDFDGGVVGPLDLVTADADGSATAGPTGSIGAAEYGRLLVVGADEVLVTTSQALVPADLNRLRDVYVKDLAAGVLESPFG